MPDYYVDPPALSTTPDPTPPTVTVGGAPLFPKDTLTVTDQTPIYTAFGARVIYHLDYGLGSAPRAGKKGEQKRAFWRSHSGGASKTVVWVAQAMNAMPVAPHPDTGAANEVLVEAALIGDIPPDGPDGQQVFTLAGVYKYELQQIPAVTDPLFVGKSPFNVKAARAINVYDFSRFITGPSLNPAAFQGGAIDF